MDPWNQLTDIFGAQHDSSTIPAYAADNICVAWPSILTCIRNHIAQPRRKKALDFGCGGGLFCRELYKMDFEVTGYEPATELAKAARANTPPAITITDSDILIEQSGEYDLIVSIMVLQFIEPLDLSLQRLLPLLKPNGLFLYAIFNPAFVMANLHCGIFSGFADGKRGFMELQPEIKVPCYIRSADEMQALLDHLGYDECYRDYPAFTAEFLQKYNLPFSTEHSEYLIQAFHRTQHQLSDG